MLALNYAEPKSTGGKTTEVFNVFLRFLNVGHVFYFLTLFYFPNVFLFKKTLAKFSSGKQVNKKHLQKTATK